MNGWWARCAVTALVVVVATTTLIARRAVSDDCLHVCAETDKDDRGCCPAAKPKLPPKTDPKVPPKTPPKTDPKVLPKPPPKTATRLDIGGDANVAGARLTLDGQPRGNVPATVETTPGRHLVEIAKDRFEPYAQWVEVAVGQTKAIAVTLKATAAAPTPMPTKPPARVAGACPGGMVHVPAGTFTMGIADGGPYTSGDPDERPAHPVTLAGYCIDRTEVTVAAYGACVATKSCTATTEPAKEDYDSLCNGTRTDRQNHPVNCVDWNQATAYCTWASKRLPTEAEWEYAARGSDGRTYPWGNERPSKRRLNACGSECVALFKRVFGHGATPMYSESDGFEATAPVGSFPDGASPVGALDLAGNVWEWTADLYGPYAAGAATNPTGATTGTARVFRGGGWSRSRAVVLEVRGTSRAKREPADRDSNQGFRCARGD